MNTPPRHASRSHQRRGACRPRARSGGQPGRDHQPVPESVEALVRDPRRHARRLGAERARDRRERSRALALHARRASARARRGSSPTRTSTRLGERRARRSRRYRASDAAPTACTTRWHAWLPPDPYTSATRSSAAFGPSPVRDVAERLLEAGLVAACRHLRVVRDEAPRHRMERRATAGAAALSSPRTTNASAASASANATRTPTIARRRGSRSPQSILSLLGDIPRKGSTRSSDCLAPGVAAARIDLRLGRRGARADVVRRRRARTQRGEPPASRGAAEPTTMPIAASAVPTQVHRAPSAQNGCGRRDARRPSPSRTSGRRRSSSRPP